MNNELAISNQSQHVFSNAAAFETAQRQATALSKSTLVPKEYQNNMPNCLIALEVSQRTGASPLQVMQNLYVVHGRPSWSSQFVIAAINSCGRFKPLRFDFTSKEGSDDWACTAWTVERDVDLPRNIRTLQQAVDADLPVLKSTKISIKMSKAEGWYSKAGSKWQTMPEQMMQYRSASFFGRIYAPDVLMGMRAEDETRDMIDVTPESTILNNLNDAIKADAVKVVDVPAQETETETAAQNAEATKPEATAPIELTLKGWERAINNSATSDEARENSFKALKQFEGDSVAINTINIVTERRIEALKKAAGV